MSAIEDAARQLTYLGTTDEGGIVIGPQGWGLLRSLLDGGACEHDFCPWGGPCAIESTA